MRLPRSNEALCQICTSYCIHQLSISWLIVKIVSVPLTLFDSNYRQWRVILNVFMKTPYSSSNKLSAVGVPMQAAGLRGCLPRYGSVRAVCNEPCYWSRHCGRNLSCGCVVYERQSSRCSGSLRVGVWKRCKRQTYLDIAVQHAKYWLWLCAISWTPAVNFPFVALKHSGLPFWRPNLIFSVFSQVLYSCFI